MFLAPKQRRRIAVAGPSSLAEDRPLSSGLLCLDAIEENEVVILVIRGARGSPIFTAVVEKDVFVVIVIVVVVAHL
jgi:hypothetical protein